ncbi:hypothetical protein FXO37_09066 [Capsicum annuum]|nr:hypothetical protein FXO37_09066 [Capsicum annuum]
MTDTVYNRSSTTTTISSIKFLLHPSISKSERKNQTISFQLFLLSSSRVHFPEAKPSLFKADSTDSVEMVRNKIMLTMGIPANHQQLTCKEKQLICSEQTLSNYGIENDTNLHLLDAIQSTYHAKAWKLISDLISMNFNILKSNVCFSSDSDHIIMLLA